MLPTANVFRWSFRWLPLVHLVLALCAAESLQLIGQSRLALVANLAASNCHLRCCYSRPTFHPAELRRAEIQFSAGTQPSPDRLIRNASTSAFIPRPNMPIESKSIRSPSAQPCVPAALRCLAASVSSTATARSGLPVLHVSSTSQPTARLHRASSDSARTRERSGRNPGANWRGRNHHCQRDPAKSGAWKRMGTGGNNRGGPGLSSARVAGASPFG